MADYTWIQDAAGVYHVFMARRPASLGVTMVKYDALCGHEHAESTVKEPSGEERCVDCLRKLAKGGRGV